MEMNTAIDNREVRAVSRFADAALRRYRSSDDTSLLLALVNAWTLVSGDKDRRIVGKKILTLLNDCRVTDPLVAREVLRHVGTPVCTCPAPVAWQAVSRFLDAEHLLSVNIEALAAAVRLSHIGEQIPTGTIEEQCRLQAERLSESRCPEAKDLAKSLLVNM